MKVLVHICIDIDQPRLSLEAGISGMFWTKSLGARVSANEPSVDTKSTYSDQSSILGIRFNYKIYMIRRYRYIVNSSIEGDTTLS